MMGSLIYLIVFFYFSGDDHFGIPKYYLEYFYTMYIGMLFISAAVFVHPGGIRCKFFVVGVFGHIYILAWSEIIGICRLYF